MICLWGACENQQGQICACLVFTWSISGLFYFCNLHSCHTYLLSPPMARTKQTAKKSSGGKAPHTEITSDVRSKQRLSKSRSILRIRHVAKPQPSLSLPWNGLPPQPCNSQNQWQVDYARFGTHLMYISFVSYARTADSCTSATTALMLCVHGVYGSQKHTSRW